MLFGVQKKESGFSLLELIITMSILAVLVAGIIPLLQNSVKRQKEVKLRDALREMRLAIDEFKRDTLGACNQPGSGTGTGGFPGSQPPGQLALPDPRSRVVIDDCKIFTVDNLDRYPPTLDALVDGVKVKSRIPNFGRQGSVFESKNATELSENKEITKVYLREIPVDPITGEKDWKFRSSYQAKDAEDWDQVNVFDVRSAAEGEAMNGEKYSDW
jgi:general secretion pathway protein G